MRGTDRQTNMLESNMVDKATTIEDPALSKPDEYKAHFKKQGNETEVNVLAVLLE